MDTILDSDLGPDGAQPQPRTIASSGKRIFATLWDSLLIFTPFFLQEVLHIRLMFPDLVFMLMVTAYRPYMEFAFGATLGKRWVKIEVVDKSYRKAGLRAILLRNVLGIVSGTAAAGSLIFGVDTPLFIDVAVGIAVLADAIAMITDAQARSLHDRLAGTLVVETRKA